MGAFGLNFKQGGQVRIWTADKMPEDVCALTISDAEHDTVAVNLTEDEVKRLVECFIEWRMDNAVWKSIHT